MLFGYRISRRVASFLGKNKLYRTGNECRFQTAKAKTLALFKFKENPYVKPNLLTKIFINLFSYSN